MDVELRHQSVERQGLDYGGEVIGDRPHLGHEIVV
jgi:hypothetical protein